jgi:hypothetical protein
VFDPCGNENRHSKVTVSGIGGKQIFEFVKLLRREDFIINEE